MKTTLGSRNNPITDGKVTIEMTEVEAKRLFMLMKAVGFHPDTEVAQGFVVNAHLQTDIRAATETVDMAHDLREELRKLWDV